MVGQGQGVTNSEITDGNIRFFIKPTYYANWGLPKSECSNELCEMPPVDDKSQALERQGR